MESRAGSTFSMPTQQNTVADIDAFAREHGVDISSAKTKAQKLNVIQEVLNG